MYCAWNDENQGLRLFQVHVPEGLRTVLKKEEFKKDKKKFKREQKEEKKEGREGREGRREGRRKGRRKRGTERCREGRKKVHMLLIFPATEFRHSEWHQI